MDFTIYRASTPVQGLAGLSAARSMREKQERRARREIASLHAATSERRERERATAPPRSVKDAVQRYLDDGADPRKLAALARTCSEMVGADFDRSADPIQAVDDCLAAKGWRLMGRNFVRVEPTPIQAAQPAENESEPMPPYDPLWTYDQKNEWHHEQIRRERDALNAKMETITPDQLQQERDDEASERALEQMHDHQECPEYNHNLDPSIFSNPKGK
jgi:hypothetical protein